MRNASMALLDMTTLAGGPRGEHSKQAVLGAHIVRGYGQDAACSRPCSDEALVLSVEEG